MEQIEDIAEENHDDGALDNLMQSQKVKLAEMPVEILERILVHLDDKSLLRASHVCTLFASVAETAFAQKYSNNSYKINRWSDDNMSFHEVMLSKYGDKIRKIEICVKEKDERLLDLAERTCCNLNSLSLYLSTKMIHPTGLKEVRLLCVKKLNRASFTKFIHKNQQIEILRLGDERVGLLGVLDGLNCLKTLKYTNYSSFTTDLPIIRLIALETLKLDLSNDDYVRALRAITCNELKSMSLVDDGDFSDLTDGVFDQICSFKTLVSLRLGTYKVTEDQLKVMARRLPHLTEFGMGKTENVEHAIRLAVRSLPKLTKLTIQLDADDYDKLANDLEESMQVFRAQFVVGTNVEIKLVYEESIISTSKDRTIAFNGDTNSLELLWVENLNEENLLKMLDGPIKGYWISHLKIINDCADATLNISKLMHKCFDSTVSVDIKSKGPITVNANATRLPSFFPRLRELNIRLENHSVVDLLEKLDEEFCMQIEELSIDTKNVQNDADQEMEHGNDITDILVKFENLEGLEVKSPAIHFDVKHLQSVCPNLNDLRT